MELGIQKLYRSLICPYSEDGQNKQTTFRGSQAVDHQLRPSKSDFAYFQGTRRTDTDRNR